MFARSYFVNAVEGCFRLFTSLRLTVVLLVIMAIGAILGMCFDQTLGFQEFNEKKSPYAWLNWTVSFFELHDAFHSWWFSISVLFLALNLIACSIERLPRIFYEYRRPRPFLTTRRLLGLPLNTKKTASSMSEATKILNIFFGKRQVKSWHFGSVTYYFNDIVPFARFGVYIVHIALLVVMFSSIYVTQKGVDGMAIIEPGRKEKFIRAKGIGGVPYIHDLGFFVECEQFRLKTFVDDSPMEFESDLAIRKTLNDEPIVRQTVRVNQPLHYAGFTFYQSSYRPIVAEKKVRLGISSKDGSYKEIHDVGIDTSITLPDGSLLTPVKLMDDFGGLGAAVRIDELQKNGVRTFFHVFRRYPEFDAKVRQSAYAIKFLAPIEQYATGLSVASVPGLPVIFFGFFLLIAGLFFCFLCTPRRYFARLRQEGDSIEIIFAAQAFRHQQHVKERFFALMKKMNEEVHE